MTAVMSVCVKKKNQVLCPFLNWIVRLSGVELCSLCILEIKPLSKVLANIFSYYSWFPFHFADVFFSCAEVF